MLADGATLAVTHHTVHIDFDARLGKGEMATAKTYLAIRTEHATGEIDQHAFQISHGDVCPHGETLDLVEHDLRACGDRLIAVAHARQDDPNGLRIIRLHSPNLPWRSMGAQHHP